MLLPWSPVTAVAILASLLLCCAANTQPTENIPSQNAEPEPKIETSAINLGPIIKPENEADAKTFSSQIVIKKAKKETVLKPVSQYQGNNSLIQPKNEPQIQSINSYQNSITRTENETSADELNSNNTLENEVNSNNTLENEVNSNNTLGNEVNSNNTLGNEVNSNNTLGNEVNSNNTLGNEVNSNNTLGNEVNSNNTLMNPFNGLKAEVNAGGCFTVANPVSLPAGDFAKIFSPNYPANYDTSTSCAWSFTAPADAYLRLTCTNLKLSLFSSFEFTDNGQITDFNCFFCGNTNQNFMHTFTGQSTNINFDSWFFCSAQGFSCTIESIAKPLGTCDCGKVNTARIVGGDEVSPILEYGWMAILTRPDALSNFCGGTLISRTYVLTAAHCTDQDSPANIKVRFGVHNKFTDPSTPYELTREVREIIQHPDYDPITIENDASLLRIDAIDLAANPKIMPVCLAAGIATYGGLEATVAGWGATSAGGQLSTPLMEVSVPVLTNDQCAAFYAPDMAITSNMLCAGSEGKDSCQGDSGGPLFRMTTAGYIEIIGIVSQGSGCGKLDFPGVYARVTALSSWITGQIGAACSPTL